MSTFDGHALAFGSCLAGLGILVTGLLALLFRNPDAPRWTRPEIVPMLVCVPVTALTGIGLGYIAFGLSRLVKGTGDSRELLVLAAMVIALALVWRALGIRRRLQGYAAAGGVSPVGYLATQPTLAIDEEQLARLNQGERPSGRAA
jgi:heme A synthase